MGERRRSASGRKTKTIGDYELISKVGKGGMGSVFRARHIPTGKTVAFKALPPSFAKNKNLVACFKREIRILLGLKHENIVRGFDAGAVGNLHYLAMEYVDGRPVTDVLVRSGRLEGAEVLRIMTDTGRALAYAHAEGLIHRDVKPDNILMRSDGVVKLCDLGLARAQDDTGFTMIGTKLGTPKYMSPEQVEGMKSIDGRADVYSLGATAYHLLTGRAPHDTGTGTMIMRAQLSEKLTPVLKVVPDADPGLAAVIEHCLAKRPDDRYRTMDDLVRDLERVAAGKEPRAAASRARKAGSRAKGAREKRGRRGERAEHAERRERPAPKKSRKLLVFILLLLILAGAAWALFLGPLKEHGEAIKRSLGLGSVTVFGPDAGPR